MPFEELEKMDFENFDRQDTVIISFGKFNGLDEIHEVDMKLYNNIPENIGRHDGHEVNVEDTDGIFFTYGNNAEKLFKVMKPLLTEYYFLKNADVCLKFTKNNEAVSELELKLND